MLPLSVPIKEGEFLKIDNEHYRITNIDHYHISDNREVSGTRTITLKLTIGGENI